MARRSGGLVPDPVGAGYAQLMVIVGIATVLITRAYLAITGYPQLGNGTLHIAHSLPGAGLMVTALLVALLFAGEGARLTTALLGGVGMGLVVDEIGKFLTRRNDYFFRPAAAVIYLVFAIMLVLISLTRRRRAIGDAQRLPVALHIAGEGLTGSITAERRDLARELVAGRDDERSRLVVEMLDAATLRERPPLLERLSRPPAWLYRLADNDALTAVLIVVFIVARVVVAIVFVTQALYHNGPFSLDPATDRGAIVFSAFFRTIAAVIALAGVAAFGRGRRPDAYRRWRAALLVGLLGSQVFAFEDSQFGAVAELPFEVVMWALLSYRSSTGEER